MTGTGCSGAIGSTPPLDQRALATASGATEATRRSAIAGPSGVLLPLLPIRASPDADADHQRKLLLCPSQPLPDRPDVHRSEHELPARRNLAPADPPRFLDALDRTRRTVPSSSKYLLT